MAGPTLASPVPVAQAACTTDPAAATAGDDVVVSCVGFAPGELVVIYFDEVKESARLGAFTASDQGVGSFTFPAPEVPAGAFTLIARGETTFTLARAPLELRPGIFITPSSGDPGDVITADLTGFQPGGEVTISWYDTETSTRLLRRVTVGEDGSLTTTFRTPGSTPGEHTIEAVGPDGASATTTFTVESS